MPSVDEIKLYVAASVQRTESAAIGIRGVLDRLDEALAQLRLTTVGSVHPSAAQALVRLEECKARLIEAETLARGAQRAVSAVTELLAGRVPANVVNPQVLRAEEGQGTR